MSYNYDLFFVAFFKHGKPQHLVGGPFIDRETAQSCVDMFGIEKHCILEMPLVLELAP